LQTLRIICRKELIIGEEISSGNEHKKTNIILIIKLFYFDIILEVQILLLVICFL